MQASLRSDGVVNAPLVPHLVVDHRLGGVSLDQALSLFKYLLELAFDVSVGTRVHNVVV